MKSVAQTVIEADRFYTIAAKTGSVIQAVENAKDGGDIRLGKYDHKPERSGHSSGWGTAFTVSATVPMASSWT